MDKNATRSPLLRLTPELRNRIYKLVLCPGSIHIWCRNSLKKTVVTHINCAVSKSSTGPMDSWQKEDAYECGSANDTTFATLDLSLLLVCKQIHEEVALLPFTSNTFIVDSPWMLATFANQLITAQRTAITSIHALLSFITYPAEFWITKTDKVRLARLTGVKTLTITLQPQFSMPSPMEFQTGLSAHLQELFPSKSLIRVNLRLQEPHYDFDGAIPNIRSMPVPKPCVEALKVAERELLGEHGVASGGASNAIV